MEQIVEFVGNHPFLIAAAALLLLLTIVNEVRLATRAFKDLSPTDAIRHINDGATVIDARSRDDFEKKHIVNALSMPIDGAAELLGKFSHLQDQTIITCCETGVAGGRAARLLRSNGFSSVYNLSGGLRAWQGENLPVTAGKSRKKIAKSDRPAKDKGAAKSKGKSKSKGKGADSDSGRNDDNGKGKNKDQAA